jgi:hypothetical protein
MRLQRFVTNLHFALHSQIIPFYICSLFALLCHHCDLQANERHVYTIFMFSGGIEGHHTETLGN